MATKKGATQQKTILDAMSDPGLFRKTFRKSLFGKDSWAVWKVFLSGLFGLPMSPEQRKSFYKHTHRTDIPTKPFREAFVVCGRRSGKSVVAALVAVFLAVFVDHSDSLVAGEKGTILILSTDRRAAKVIFGYVIGLLQSPLLKSLVLGERKEAVDLTNGISIQIATASFRAVRGYTIIAAVCDEIAFWSDFDGNGANPDSQILEALWPAMLTIPRALLLCISSPYSRTGVLWRNYNLFFGQVSDTLIWQGASGDMNPLLPRAEIERAYKADPISASAEYGAQFREASDEFISLQMVMDRTAKGVHERVYDESKRYYGFVDSSGGKNDSAVLAIGHFENGKAQLDCVREVEAPHAPASVCREFATVAKAYHIHEIVGDRFAAGFASEHYERNGITYIGSEKNRSEIYLELLPNLLSGNILLLDNAKLQTQLSALERKPGRNVDVIDHGSGSADDVANAVAGVLGLVLEDNATASLGLLLWEKEISSGARRDPSVESPPRKAAKPVAVAAKKDHLPTPCPLCSGPRIRLGSGRAGQVIFHCNQCSADNGKLQGEGENICPNAAEHDFSQVVGGLFRCQHCGKQPARDVIAGARFSDLKRIRAGSTTIFR